ncbi:MAG: PIG-L deacetylase family protein [Planctomycetota bacterium]
MVLIRDIDALRALADRPKRLLAVFPHPDDEAYGCAGVLARAGADPDAAAVLFTLTRGEASSYGPANGLSPDAVGDLREERLETVAEVTGIDGLIVGRFPDSRLARVPLDEVGDAIGRAIDAFSPHVVVGHDPRGVNAHADHVASHWAIRQALLTRPGIRFAMIVYRQADCDAIAPRLLLPTADAEIDAVIDLTPEETRKKEACLRAHDALVTVVEDGPAGLLRRPAVERFDFLGEEFDPPAGDLFYFSGV